MRTMTNTFVYVILMTLIGAGCVMEESEELSMSRGESALWVHGDISQYTSDEVVEILGLKNSAQEAECLPIPNYTCPSAYGSCASWSQWETCGPKCDLYDVDCAIGICYDDPDPIHGNTCTYLGRETGSTSRYQVCHNSAGETCTNTQASNWSSCGC